MLLAMGIQNSLVTNISKSTVRTTHLTGLFTDLGIELSQLFFYKKPEEVKKLKTSIFLRLSIISFFFMGCFFGGIIYQFLEIKTLFVAALILLIAQCSRRSFPPPLHASRGNHHRRISWRHLFNNVLRVFACFLCVEHYRFLVVNVTAGGC